jgi:hypothetical protein
MTNASIVESLTSAQEQELRNFSARWNNPSRPQPTDREAVKAALSRLYVSGKIDLSPILWCESPWQLCAMTGMLLLSAIAPGGYADLHKKLAADFAADARWSYMWRKFQEQFPKLNLPSDQKTNLVGLLGKPVTSDIRIGVSSHVSELLASFGEQLALPVQLDLRTAFRRRGNNGNGNRFLEEPMLIRAQFGLIQMQGLLGENLVTDLMLQLSSDTNKEVRAICEERISADGGIMGQLSARMQLRNAGAGGGGPVDGLFEAFNHHINLPSNVNNLQPAAFVLQNLPVDVSDSARQPVDDWLVLKENLFHLDCMHKLVLVCESPIAASLNDRDQLHNPDGAALEFRDGFKIYAINGVILPPDAILAPHKLQLAEIERQENVEVRRILIQQYGMERYLQDSGAEQIDVDEYGVLYRKSLPTDEPIVVVKVINATPEPDGTYKYYFLRVPPHMTTARAAVAWTFNMNSEEYEPRTES